MHGRLMEEIRRSFYEEIVSMTTAPSQQLFCSHVWIIWIFEVLGITLNQEAFWKFYFFFRLLLLCFAFFFSCSKSAVFARERLPCLFQTQDEGNRLVFLSFAVFYFAWKTMTQHKRKSKRKTKAFNSLNSFWLASWASFSIQCFKQTFSCYY